MLSIVLIVLVVVMLRNFSVASNSVKNVRSSARYEQCALWLEQNTPQGSIVFHSSWDNFPELFFYNHHNYYLSGLTPDFMYVYGKSIYDIWNKIRKGQVPTYKYAIKTTFNSSYVFVDNRYSNFGEKLKSDEDIEEVFHSPDCRIYFIK